MNEYITSSGEEIKQWSEVVFEYDSTEGNVLTDYLLHGQGERFRGLIEEGSVLQSDGLEAIYKDADAHKEAYCFADAFEDVKDRNMCIVVGGGDDIAPGKHMIMPLWNRLKEHDTVAVQKQVTFDCDHCMCNVRMALAEYIAQFMKEVLGE